MSTTGSTTTTTAYYGSLALSVNGALSYTLSDGLGSVSEAVTTSGAVTATQLYAPYGNVRYQSGTLPTDQGFTGQRSDASTSGLDYDNARYYDPVAGQFTSADTTLAGGLNRYAYVGGNPESATDPTGHQYAMSHDELGARYQIPSPKPYIPYIDLGVLHMPVPQSSDSCYPQGCYSVAFGATPTSIEQDDGKALAQYFGTHVVFQSEKNIQGQKNPDYQVYTESSAIALMGGEIIRAGEVTADSYAPRPGVDLVLPWNSKFLRGAPKEIPQKRSSSVHCGRGFCDSLTQRGR